MFDGRRSLKNILLAPTRPEHYRAALRSLVVYESPLPEVFRYVTTSGQYPRSVMVKTPLGRVQIRLHTPHDLRTVNEIFCRLDYAVNGDEKVIVDFGSNIGVSALYFLSHCSEARIHLFEPLPTNLTKLKNNLFRFDSRYTLHPIAVGLSDGPVIFGSEPTGRYGGIGLEGTESLEVQCRKASSIVAEIIQAEGTIDILKVDIESLEKEILASLDESLLRHIKKIYVEQHYESNPFPEKLFSFKQKLSIAEFTRRDG